jgi:uncharacterized protein (PEP-CTERM system associated)
MASDDISRGMPAHFCLGYGTTWTFVISCCVASALMGGEAMAAKQGVETGISVQETYSDNPLLLAEPAAKSDFVTEIAPYVRINEDSERLNFSFDYSPHLLLYAGNPNEDVVRNYLKADSRAELVENLFFFDAKARVAQDSQSPFGSNQGDASTNNANLVDTYTLDVSPYLLGKIADDLTWDVRNRTIWNRSSGTNLDSNDRVIWSASLATPIRLYGSRIEYSKDETTYQADSQNLTAEIARTYLYFQPRSGLRFTAIGGIENNNYTLDSRTQAIYGAGVDWKPSPRTSASFQWQERFFGPSYVANLDHRTRMTAWNISYSRDISTYTQELFRQAPGNTGLLLDNLLLSRFPDPAARDDEVQNVLTNTGLPAFMAGPLTYYTRQISLIDRVQTGFVIAGARNAISLVVFRSTNQRLSDAVPLLEGDAFLLANKFTQTGYGLDLSHRLTAQQTLNVDWLETRTVGEDPAGSKSTQDAFHVRWSRSLGSRTKLFAVARYVKFESVDSGFQDYRERAIVGGIAYRF